MFFLLLLLLFIVVAAFACWAVSAVVPRGRVTVARSVILLFDIASAAVLILGRGLVESDGLFVRMGLIVMAMVWMGELAMSVLVTIVRLVRCIYRRAQSVDDGDVHDPERRRMLKGAMLYPLIAAGSSVYGGTVGRTNTIVREIDVPVDGIGDELKNFRIAQISDIHLGPFYSLDDLEALMKQAAQTKADALCLTGDIFDDDAINEEAVKLIDRHADDYPQGIWFCYGNHEYFRDIVQTNRALRKTRIHVLKDEKAQVMTSKRPLYFAGVDYPHPRYAFEEIEARSAKRVFDGIPKNAVTILLAHHPDFIDDGAEHGATLVLTGHTHGGQIGLFGVSLVPPVFKYMRGMYRVGDTIGYVHSGNGSWFPYRLGCPPEIAVFRLTGK